MEESKNSSPLQVTFLIVPRFNMSTLVTMIEPMRIANYLSPQPIYAWDIVSFDGDQITASNGLTLPAHLPADRKRRGEVIFVMGSWGAESYTNKTVFSWIRRQAREGARICAVELGTYLVARAGLLSGRKVTTHWSYGPGFQEQFPDIAFVEQIYTAEAGLMTCGGGLAGVDLVLRLIGEAQGESLVSEIADQLMHHPVRPATAPQRRTMGRSTDTLPPMVREAIALIEKNIAEPLSVPDIAELLNVSQRQMERQFKAAIGCTVVQFGLLLRLQHARVLLISTSLSVRDIATASGFNTRKRQRPLLAGDAVKIFASLAKPRLCQAHSGLGQKPPLAPRVADGVQNGHNLAVTGGGHGFEMTTGGDFVAAIDHAVAQLLRQFGGF